MIAPTRYAPRLEFMAQMASDALGLVWRTRRVADDVMDAEVEVPFSFGDPGSTEIDVRFDATRGWGFGFRESIGPEAALAMLHGRKVLCDALGVPPHGE